MNHFLHFYIFALVLLNRFFGTTCINGATAPGDVIIGGLFPIHDSVSVTKRDDGTETRLVQSLIMVHAVEEVNKNHELGNLTLGYTILDSCSDVTTALNNTLSFMKRNSEYLDGAEQPSPPVLAVIGDYYSEISIAVTRQLNLEHIPQISYGATSGLLSDKVRFPSFMRTVPEDDHQAQAIIKILRKHQWNWVGVVTTDSDYGRYIADRLLQHATNNNICFAFTSVLPDGLSDKTLDEHIATTVKSITENTNVKVIVSFAKPYHMTKLFNCLLEDARGREKVWVASDTWSDSTDINLKQWNLSDIGTVFGTTLISGNSTRFKQYLRNLDVNPDHQKNNTFLYNFLKEHQQDPRDTTTEVLMKKINPYAVLSIELAVRAIAKAVVDLCNNRDCKTSQRLELNMKYIYNASMITDSLTFNTFHFHRGDLNSGYDVILWRQTSTSAFLVMFLLLPINELHQIKEHDDDTLSTQVDVISRCSNSCDPGYRKKSAQRHPLCCYECEPCPENYYSNTSDSTECHRCDPDTQYSNNRSEMCTPKTVVFLKWTDPYNDALLAFTAVGALLTIVVGIIFLARWNTPVVRASVGPICILLLFSLLSTFVSVILFGGKPNTKQCQARQVLFGLSFTLCVSCIMVKSFKIILFLKKLYQPYIIIAVCMAGQVLICALWLSLKSPEPGYDNMKNQMERLHFCNEMSYKTFGVMLGYIGILALICFGVAFKGRKLPQCYNDAKFITFSMLIYFICWIIFGPVYVTVKGTYLPAVEMVVILISAYGILFCQFITKCYIILFKQEANTESAFRESLRNYSLSDIKDGDGNWVSSFSPGGIQTIAVDVEAPMPNSVSSDQLTDRSPSISSGESVFSLSPSLNPPLIRQKSNNSKKQLRRFLSLPS
uniref:G-protein coupled receptor family C group 6 member A n=1 Tax=Lates calcarifer TaxID=8187 RepID=A0A4W6EJT3_LATCA